jgi:thioester reductase-like protein
MPTILLTGFPGFLGSQLAPRILARAPDAMVVCLIQPKFADVARVRAEALAVQYPDLASRLTMVEGDITQPQLGLAAPETLRRDVAEIYHLAAVYDLSVPRDVGMRVNVEGTRRVLEFAESCPGLSGLHYISTCYVSGRHPGVYTEDDLDTQQTFNNHYEETKFLAEVAVRERMAGGLAATVYRPAIVVGDSQTGATQKYDGPYFVIRWVLRQPRVAIVPIVGDPAATRLNVVPRDFVVDAIAHLSGLPRARGKVYQLADSDPLTVDALLTAVAHATGRRIVRVPLPVGVAKGAINHVPGVYRLMRIPASAIDYFVHPTSYATSNTQADLEGSGIGVPAFTSYVDRLVQFARAHPEFGAEAMS